VAGTCPQAQVPDAIPAGVGAVGVIVLLRAFASGAAALTGVEAISNGVGAFKQPRGENAAKTLTAMGLIAISLFLGVSYLAVEMGARPSESVSVLSEVARATFPASSAAGFLYYLVQALTFGILVLAANTSYQGFPRLAAVLARDGYFPRQFVNLGDRLVYSNGIVVLAGVAALLIWAFHADVISLIHLYVIGVFIAFTLSQTGMVRHWRAERGPGWQRRAAINGLGALTTGLVALLVIQTKFLDGAWMVTIAIPVLVLLFFAVHRHYRVVARRLHAGAAAVRAEPAPSNTTVIYVEAIDPATELAAWYARRIAGDDLRAIHVPDPARRLSDPRGDWWPVGRCRVETLNPRDGRVDAVLDYLWSLPHGESRFVTLIVPESFERASLARAITRRTTFSLKVRLRTEPGIVVTDVPVVARDELVVPADSRRIVGRVLVSGVQAASLRAIRYAETLGLDDTRALFFAFDEEEEQRMRAVWLREEVGIPLEVVRAPYRDLGEPLLHHLRTLTGDPGTVVSVIMPELVFSGWRALLHNQRALYLKRLLLFEPHVILSSVPYHLP
jgi:hypothetical protein